VQEITLTASKSTFREIGSIPCKLYCYLPSADLAGRLNAFHAVCLGKQRSLNDIQHGRPTSDAECGSHVRERHLILCITKIGRITGRIESYSSKSSLDADAVRAGVPDVSAELQKDLP
jgi:hypothetical protein